MKNLILLSCLITIARGAPIEDKIVGLPGLKPNPSLNFDQYSGYLDGTDGTYLHYWFVESSNNPVADPLVLWLNGGPGCSSLDGLLNELGPYLLNDNGTQLNYNKYSWNTIANVLFIEAPKCVGFSYSASSNCSNSDDSTSLDNYFALKSFFKKFPEYKKNDFYITGESYAGVYVPTLSKRVLDGNHDFPMNFKGYAIGNGLGSYALNSNSLIFFAYYHGLFGNVLWNSLVDNCCRNGIIGMESCHFYNSPYPRCQSGVKKAMHLIYEIGINMYNMYADCVPPSSNQSRYHMDLKNIFYGDQNVKVNMDEFYSRKNNLSEDPPCVTGESMRKYLNREDVREVLHIPISVGAWDICSDAVYAYYERDYVSTLDLHKELVKQVRALIYNGDIDMACNFLGDEWLTEMLNLPVTEDRRPWYENKQVGGFVKKFENLTYTTIRGSGHMVPQDKPGPSLKMIASFIFDKPF